MAYFALLFAVAWWVIRSGRDTADDYFLAGRNLGWFVVGASIFASNIGSEHLVGLAGAGATSGVALAHYELHAWCLLVLGWVLVPFYIRSRVYTMPEFLERRFSPASRWVLSLVSLVAYVITKIAVGIFAGGVVFGVLLPGLRLELGSIVLNSFWIGSVLVVVLTGVYTVLGGMRAVAYTEAIQTLILVIGSLVLTVYGLNVLGGWGQLRAVLGPEMFNLWKPLVPAGLEGTWAPVKEAGRIAWYFNGDYPWLGMLFCAPIVGLWYWCTDQYIVQRTLGAPDQTQARRGTIFAACLKLLPVFIFIIPGMIALALAKTGQGAGLSRPRRSGDRPGGAVGGAGGVPADGARRPADRHPRHRRRRAARRPHELARGRLQRLLDALHDRLLRQVPARRDAGPAGVDRPRRHRGDGADRSRLDPGDSGRARPLRVPAGRVGLHRAADLHRVLLRRVHEAPERSRRARGAARRVGDGAVPAGRRHAGQPRASPATSRAIRRAACSGSSTTSTSSTWSLLIFVVSALTMFAVSYVTAAPSAAQIQGLTFATVTPEQRAETRRSWNHWDVINSAIVLSLILTAYIYFSG